LVAFLIKRRRRPWPTDKEDSQPSNGIISVNLCENSLSQTWHDIDLP